MGKKTQEAKSPAQGCIVSVGPICASIVLILELILLTIKLSCLVKLCVRDEGRHRLHVYICLASKCLYPLGQV